MLALLLSVFLLQSPTSLTSQLNSSEARTSALEGLIDGRYIPKKGERVSIDLALREILANQQLPLSTRIYAIRAMGTVHSNAQTLMNQLNQASDNEVNRVLSIEAARALARFAPPAALSQLLSHTDPAVRAIAAKTGGPTSMLCKLASNDPWHIVREAAVFGLSTRQDGIPCILRSLNDDTVAVRMATVTVLADLANELSQQQRAETITRLKAIVKDSRQEMTIRGQAMTALGALGDCAAAKSALTINLKSNKLKGLLNEALGALQRCEELSPFLGQMLESQNDHVVALSLRTLISENPKLGCRALKSRPSGFKVRRKSLVKDLEADCRAQKPLGERRVGIPNEADDDD